MSRCWFKPGAPPADIDRRGCNEIALIFQKSPATLHEIRHMRFEADVVLDVQSQFFYAHKHVLAAASPFLEKLFRDNPAELVRLNIPDVSPALMSAVLKWFYGEPLPLNMETLEQLLSVAIKFELFPVVIHCFQYLERQLHPSNAIRILKLSQPFGHTILHTETKTFIRRHFVQVSRTEEFRNLDFDSLVAIVTCDKLNVTEEREVFIAVATWVAADVKNRCKFLLKLVSLIRCQLLTRRFLGCCIRSEVVNTVPECRNYLENIYYFYFRNNFYNVSHRSPDIPGFIYIAGGRSSDVVDGVEAYDLGERAWSTVSRISKARSGLSGAVFRRKFYVVGSNYVDGIMIEKYDPVVDACQPLYRWFRPRDSPSVATLDGHLYVAGGSAGGMLHHSVGRFDLEDESWQQVSSLRAGRKSAAAVVVNNLLYVIGGFDGVASLRDVECYNQERNEWIPAAPMSIGRHAAGAAVLDRWIYVAGGCDGAVALCTVEKYYTRSDFWVNIETMRVPRSGLTLTAAEGKLYAIGGFGQDAVALDTMEIYDPELGEWEEGPPMTKGRGGHAAGLIHLECAVHSVKVSQLPSSTTT